MLLGTGKRKGMLAMMEQRFSTGTTDDHTFLALANSWLSMETRIFLFVVFLFCFVVFLLP